MRIVIAYDISDNKRRRRVDRLLRGFGLRHQESVFEFDLPALKIIKLKRSLQKRINTELDQVRIFTLCAKDVQDIRYCGCSECCVPEEHTIV